MKKSEKSNKFLLLWYSHPRAAIALILVLVNLLVIALFTAILSIVSGNPFFDELAYLFTYTMCSDGIYDFVNDQEDVTCFVIKIVLTVVQMVIFSGALIGFTTDVLQSTIDKRLKNAGKLTLKNHYVFLNWSSIGPNLIYDLSYLDGDKTVVILSEEDSDDVLTSIQNIFSENNVKMRGIRLFIKTGDPNSAKHLNDISLNDAKHVGILLSNEEDTGTHSISTKDLSAFKMLMAILYIGTKANIVVEVEKNETAEKIEQFIAQTNDKFTNMVSVFSHNSVIGRVLGRAVVNPIFSYLYHELLSYEGCEFYGIPTMDLEQALQKYNNCIPVVNYDDDDVVDEDGNKEKDQLYILSENETDLGERKEPRSFVIPLEYRENITREDFTLVIFSDSNREVFVIDELEKFNKLYNKNIKYEIHSFKENIDEVAEHICQIEGKKKILLLSNETGEALDQDADVFISLLAIRIGGKIGTEIPIFSEIINPRNLSPMQSLGVVSVVISSKIISLFMIQLLTHPESKKFYQDIIASNDDDENSVDEIDFDVARASELLVFDGEFLEFSCKSEFVQSFFAASQKTKMCIGYKRAEASCSELIMLCDDMDRKEPLRIYPDDELIFACY